MMEESFFFYLNTEFIDSVFLKKRSNLKENDTIELDEQKRI